MFFGLTGQQFNQLPERIQKAHKEKERRNEIRRLERELARLKGPAQPTFPKSLIGRMKALARSWQMCA
jgi:hypothetical protein